MDSISLISSNLTLFIHLTDLSFDLQIRGNEDLVNWVNMVNLGQLSFSFNLDHRDKMFVKFLSNSLLYLT